MSVTRRAYSSNSSNGVVLNVTKPTGTIDGDYMIAICLHGSGSDASIGAPAGWSQIGTTLINTEFNAKVYYKVASSEGATYQFSNSISNNFHCVIISYYGHDTGTPLNDNDQVINTGSQAAAISATSTPTVANCLLVFIAMSDATATETFTWDASMTEVFDLDGIGNLILALAEEQVTTATSYTRTATKSGTVQRLGCMILALAPATGGGSSIAPVAVNNALQQQG